jgi:hypothetical protein
MNVLCTHCRNKTGPLPMLASECPGIRVFQPRPVFTDLSVSVSLPIHKHPYKKTPPFTRLDLLRREEAAGADAGPHQVRNFLDTLLSTCRVYSLCLFCRLLSYQPH